MFKPRTTDASVHNSFHLHSSSNFKPDRLAILLPALNPCQLPDPAALYFTSQVFRFHIRPTMPQSQPLFADSIMAVAPASRPLSEMSMDEKAGLYRALMSPLNLGYAMWFPFCFWGRKSNVDVGDVGWMTESSFFPLFSTPMEAKPEDESCPNFDGNPPGETEGRSGSTAALLPFVPLLSPGIDVVETTKPCSSVTRRVRHTNIRDSRN